MLLRSDELRSPIFKVSPLLVPLLRNLSNRHPAVERQEHCFTSTELSMINFSGSRPSKVGIQGDRAHPPCSFPSSFLTEISARSDSLERVRRIELPYSRWQRDALPLSYTRIFRLGSSSIPNDLHRFLIALSLTPNISPICLYV